MACDRGREDVTLLCDPSAVKRQLHKLDERASILDTLLDDTHQFQKALGRDDQSRLDQYLTSVREIEQRLDVARQWELRPKPTTDEQPPDDIRDQKQFFEKFDLMLSMARLAFESDSTRIITLMVDAFATPPFKLHPDQNTTDGYHNLSHHGQSESKVQQLIDADHQQMMLLHKLFSQLAEVREGEDRLLDRTMILFGSNMGDANTHDKIATGRKEDKFGIDIDVAPALYARASQMPHIRPLGIAVHIGSQLTSLDPFRAAFCRCASSNSAT